MTNRLDDTLKAVERVLASLPADHDRLVARFDADGDESMDPTVTLLRASDGITHLVHVQVGNRLVSGETSSFEVVDLGDGMTLNQYEGVTHGNLHASAGPRFEADLAALLVANRNAFEPVMGPGIGNHPLTAEMVKATRLAVEAHNQFCEDDRTLTLALNASGQVGDGNDVLTFVLPNGESLPFVVATGMGFVVRYDLDSGNVLARVDRDREKGLAGLGGMVADALHADAPTPRAP